MKTGIIVSLILIALITQVHNKEEEVPKNETTTPEPSKEPPTDTGNTEIPETPEIPPTPITIKTKLPEAKIILPIRRRGTSETVLNVAPCGGITRREANTLTEKGTNIHFVWETVTPSSNGNCTVKISPGIEKEENFTVLYPKGIITNAKGEFPCGLNKGFEGQEFILPEDYVCDKCTLQWKWNTPYGSIYSCSDVIINGNKIGNCLAKCQNGGSCFNGQCICVDDFHGEFCQSSSKSSADIGIILLIIFGILLIIGLIVAAVFFFCGKDHSWIYFWRPNTESLFNNQPYNASNPSQQGENQNS